VAIINIQLDTSRGDTLQGALHALMTSARLEFPKYPEPKSIDGSNPFLANGEDFQPSTVKASETVTAPLKIDTNAKWPEPLLSPMDGDRKRGEAGPGHRRRTNAQIAEDEVYFKRRGNAAVTAMELGTESPEARAPTDNPFSPKSDAATTQPSSESVNASAISSGNERVNPDDEQDAADEAAESAARKGSESTLDDLRQVIGLYQKKTLDDLRQVIGLYQKKFGMAQAAAKSLEYNGMPIFEVPSKDIPLIIARWQAAIEHDKKEDGAKFTPVKTESGVVQGTPSTATREEVNIVIESYANTFDEKGSDSSKWVATKADIPKIMERLFGVGKNNFNAIERSPENYGRVKAAIQAEINKNTFGRTAK
jgi:hypothetical protein